MAGITADANILIDKARLDAQRYELKYSPCFHLTLFLP